MPQKLTDSELMVLGLLAEMPRHGYELEQTIEQRSLREWTQIGFSSIYFILGKLEKNELIKTEKPSPSKSKKIYQLTQAGKKALIDQTITALKSIRPNSSSVLIGMLHWPMLTRKQALDALRTRKHAIANELERLNHIHFEQQPLPDHIDIMFELSLKQLNSEADWINKTLDYMQNKTWAE